jgi:hypothetical protein
MTAVFPRPSANLPFPNSNSSMTVKLFENEVGMFFISNSEVRAYSSGTLMIPKSGLV